MWIEVESGELLTDDDLIELITRLQDGVKIHFFIPESGVASIEPDDETLSDASANEDA
jgi:hypothetical protein